MAAAPTGMPVGSVSEPLVATDGMEYLIFLPPTWTGAASAHPVLLFLHGVGGINNAKGCRNPGLTTQFPLLNPAYAAKVEHIVLVPVAPKENWLNHFASCMALVDDAVANLGGDPKRVSVAGQSMGGAGAWLFASKQPDRFCAVVPICGYIPDGVMPSVVEALKAKPIWLLRVRRDTNPACGRTPPSAAARA